MEPSHADRSADEQFERLLHQSLYRFDCPSPHLLGEYQLELLPPEDRIRVAAHAVDCSQCQTELTTLRAFLSDSIQAPESFLGRARRVVATLMAPAKRPAYGGLRGDSRPSVRVYEVEDVTVTIGPGQHSGSLVGLVMVTSTPPEQLVGRQVRLVPVSGRTLVAELDEIGNFEFDAATPGNYVLELDLLDSLVVIEALPVD